MSKKKHPPTFVLGDEPVKETPPPVEQETECEILDAPELDTRYEEMLDKNQRLVAEFDNFRKRTAKEMAARYDDGVRAACESLLPMVDNFTRALVAHNNKEDSFYQGVAMIARQLDGILADLGVKPIEIESGCQFDPNLHNAVAHDQDEDFGPNEISLELQKGYTHKDKVLRHSMVKVVN